LRRAEIAEHREIAHQDWAANQIFALRERLRELEQTPRAHGVPHEQYLEVHRSLAAARARVAELEAQLTAHPSQDPGSSAVTRRPSSDPPEP
jgi:hypothetical protein